MKVIAGIYLMLCFTMATPVKADDSEYVKNGLYLGVLFAYNGMSGDFDDSVFYTNGSTVYDVPDVDDGMGFGLILGTRTSKGALELGYQRTSHDTNSSFVDIGKSTAYYNVIDLNFKFDVFAQKQLKPYFLVGLGIPWLTIEDSQTNGVTYEDETFVGFDLNLGAGMAYYFHPQWAITGGVIYRWNWFGSVDGESIDNSLLEKALGLTVGITYTF